MSVVIKEGIGYGQASKAAFYSEVNGKQPSTPPDNTLQTSTAPGPWAPWGTNNIDPVNYAADIENCGVLNAAIESKARMAVGRGFLPFILKNVLPDGSEQVEFVNDPEILSWLERNDDFLYSWRNIYNMLGYGWGATQIILDNEGKNINRIKATDVYQARLKKIDPKAKEQYITEMYLSADWRNAQTQMPPDMPTLPVLEECYELEDLQQKAEGSAREFVILHRMLKNGRIYYPRPLWMSAKAWVDLTKSIPGIKNSMNTNQVSIKYLIIISPEYWKKFHEDWDSYSPEKKEEIIQEKYDSIDNYLVGNDKAGKSIIAGAYVDTLTKTVIPDITITVIDDKIKDGRMLPDSAAADKQILFSMFFNPAIWGGNLLGDGASGGAGSGSDIREAAAVQLVLMHAERMLNLKVFNLVKYFNGWYEKHKSNGMLVFRYQNSILTTLDTGKSAQNLNL